MTKKLVIGGILAVILLIQFIHIDTPQKDFAPEADILIYTDAPQAIQDLLKVACYDCHSNNTSFPWYNNIVPIQWWLADHINHGRKHLNFSGWGSFSAKRINHKIKECIELIQAEEMPLDSYTWTHKDAILSTEDRMLMIEWFKSIRIRQNTPSQNQ